jgi:hypothetical protein
MHTETWLGNLKERALLEELRRDGRIILKWLLKKQDGMALSGSVWFRIETSCERGNEFWIS